MTSYREEDSTFLGYDLECIEESDSWVVYIYKDGKQLHKAVNRRKADALLMAKNYIANIVEPF